MLKKIVFGLCIPLAILGAAALSFSGCGKSAPASDSAGKMKVVATTTMLTDLARQIGGDKVEVSGLMKAGVDPHLYQAGAGDVDAMNKADIVVYNGVHLEGKMAIEMMFHHKFGFNGGPFTIRSVRYKGNDIVWYFIIYQEHVVPVMAYISEVDREGKIKRLNIYPL